MDISKGNKTLVIRLDREEFQDILNGLGIKNDFTETGRIIRKDLCKIIAEVKESARTELMESGNQDIIPMLEGELCRLSIRDEDVETTIYKVGETDANDIEGYEREGEGENSAYQCLYEFPSLYVAMKASRYVPNGVLATIGSRAYIQTQCDTPSLLEYGIIRPWMMLPEGSHKTLIQNGEFVRNTDPVAGQKTVKAKQE